MTRCEKNIIMKILLIGVLVLKINHVLSIVNSQDNLDITNDYNFNCRWTGGSDPSLECNCLSGTEEFTIKDNSIPPYDVASITLRNCRKITLEPNAISSMRSLRAFTLDGISSVVLHPNSLYWLGEIRSRENLVDWESSVPSLRLRLLNSNIELISNNAIHGRINYLEITNCVLQHVSPFAVSNLQQMLNIRIDNTSFKTLESQSFKKFSTESLVISSTVFDSIPSRAFYDIVVKQQFVLDNITILNTLKPSGFMMLNPHRFDVINSNINSISGSGFKVTTRGPVNIKNNNFNYTANSAFRGISLNKEDPNAFETMHFEKNVFNHLSKDALMVDDDSFRAEFLQVQLSEMCECGTLERYFRHGENTLELSCIVETPISTSEIRKEWMSVDSFQRTRCSPLDTKSGTAYIIAGLCVISLVVIGSLVGLYFFKLHRSKSYGSGSTDKNGKLSMIVPDGRTYKETELCVIVERADLLTTDL